MFFNLLETQTLREYFEHESDIVDLAWQTRRNDRGHVLRSQLIATCSLDSKVILWNIDK